MPKLTQSREGGNTGASGSIALDTEQSFLLPAAQAPVDSQRKPYRFIVQSIRGRMWLDLNAAAISAETVERITTTLAQENRLSEKSLNGRLPGYARREDHVRLCLNTDVWIETMKRVSALVDEDERRCGTLLSEKPAARLNAPRRAQPAPKNDALIPTTNQHGTRVAARNGPKARQSEKSLEVRAAAADSIPKAGRPQRMIPWLVRRNGLYYVCWYDETRRRTKRRSTRTRDPLKA